MPHDQLVERTLSTAAAAALALLFTSVSIAATSVDEHRPAGASGSVEIDNVAGEIDVQGWDKSEVAVTGSIGKDVERVEVTGGGNRTSIRVVLPPISSNWPAALIRKVSASARGSAKRRVHNRRQARS